MNPLSRSWLAVALALAMTPACRSAATQVELFVDTNAPLDRTMTLRMVAFRGAVQPEQLPARLGTPMLVDHAFVRGVEPGQIQLPGSFGVLSATVGDTGPVTVWIRATLAPSPSAPEVYIDRVARFSFVRNARLVGRVFLSVACGDRATGCSSVRANECTVSVRCREQGATCGDTGDCVSPEISLSTGDAGAFTDVSSGVDATTGRVDGAAMEDTTVLSDTAGPNDTTVLSDTAVPSDTPLPNDTMSDSPAVANDAMSPAPSTQLISPLSTSTVTQKRPTVRFRVPADAMSTSVQFCRDRSCTMLIERVPGTSSARPSADLPTGWVYWNLTYTRDVGGVPAITVTTAWQFWVPVLSATTVVDRSFGTLPDLNGDGFSDLAAGARDATILALGNAGRVAVFHGGPGGISASPTVNLSAPVRGDHFGTSVRSAGDVNGDGYADLLIGAPNIGGGAPATPSGSAYLFFGGPSGPSVGSFRRLVGVSGGESFGVMVSSAGDVNGDGYADVIVGASTATVGPTANAGRISLFLGSSNGLVPIPSQTFEGTAANTYLGNAISDAGDVNDDGFNDVLFGLRNVRSSPMGNDGEARVHFGSAMGLSPTPSITLVPPHLTCSFGYAVSGGVDLNNDGYSDYIIGAPGPFADPMGIPSYGMAGLSSPGGAAPRRVTFIDAGRGDLFGSVVSVVPDMNGDGYAEAIFGAERSTVGARTLTGQTFIHYGERGGGFGNIRSVTTGTSNNEYFGFAVAGVGDINGDRLGDVVIGSRIQGVAPLTFAGRVSVFHGIMGGFGLMPRRQIDGTLDSELFGSALAQLGYRVPSQRIALVL